MQFSFIFIHFQNSHTHVSLLRSSVLDNIPGIINEIQCRVQQMEIMKQYWLNNQKVKIFNMQYRFLPLNSGRHMIERLENPRETSTVNLFGLPTP